MIRLDRAGLHEHLKMEYRFKYDLENEARVEAEIDRIAAKLNEKLAQHTDLPSAKRVVTHNYNLNESVRSLQDAGLDRSKLYTETLETHAHVPTADYILNLDHLTCGSDLSSGDQILFWGGGVGVSSAGTILEKC